MIESMKTCCIFFLLLLLTAASCTVTKRRYSAGWNIEWHKQVNSNHPAPHTKTATPNDQFATNAEEKASDLLLHPETTESEVISSTSALKDEVVLSDALETAVEKETPKSQPDDTIKKRQKWIPYKVRKEQQELEKVANGEEIEPKKRTALTIVSLVIGSLFIAYNLYGLVFLLTLIGMLLLDSGVTILFLTYVVPFLFAWWLYTEITVLMVRIWSPNRKEETYKAFRKRVLLICRLVAIALALISVLIIGLLIL